jgi:MSHA biogenesis protein MshL
MPTLPATTAFPTTRQPSARPGGQLARRWARFVGLAFQAANFAALLSLETKGVSVLARIATINNQKAVLKVGTDGFRHQCHDDDDQHDVAPRQREPDPATLFSGMLDVTPQIDETAASFCTFILPSATWLRKTDRSRHMGQFKLPLASSVNGPTASCAQDGNIVAIGG